MLDVIPSLTRKEKVMLEFGIILKSNANCSPADRSKTRLSTRFQTEVNLGINLN